ncbi:hypothetical protein GYH30_014093 [Glycine max]|uniref:Uncharacterized protein n=1 Tax=Glycine max TaxID=3847 RepID=A0A0R0JGW5_SOYBN|nr:hypothetical protein GYH30_014093 [Glycine max]
MGIVDNEQNGFEWIDHGGDSRWSGIPYRRFRGLQLHLCVWLKLKRATLLIWFLSDLGLNLEREGLGQRRRKLREEEEEKEVKRGSDTAGDRLWRRRTVRKEIM